jgi:hypothetical protein
MHVLIHGSLRVRQRDNIPVSTYRHGDPFALSNWYHTCATDGNLLNVARRSQRLQNGFLDLSETISLDNLLLRRDLASDNLLEILKTGGYNFFNFIVAVAVTVLSSSEDSSLRISS